MELGGKYFEKYRISPLGIDISLVESMESNYILNYSENERKIKLNQFSYYEDNMYKHFRDRSFILYLNENYRIKVEYPSTMDYIVNRYVDGYHIIFHHNYEAMSYMREFQEENYSCIELIPKENKTWIAKGGNTGGFIDIDEEL